MRVSVEHRRRLHNLDLQFSFTASSVSRSVGAQAMHNHIMSGEVRLGRGSSFLCVENSLLTILHFFLNKGQVLLELEELNRLEFPLTEDLFHFSLISYFK